MTAEFALACPYFFPTVRHDAELWPFRRRLPLGDGFQGECMAPGNEGARPEDSTLRECCNLGYSQCPRLPQAREADAVHFSVACDRDGTISLHWVLVKDHAAAAFGQLHFERSHSTWREPHPTERIQRMAQCYLEAYLTKRGELRAAAVSQ